MFMLVYCHLIATASQTTWSSYLVKMKNVESSLLSKFSVFCGLFENRKFCWLKYLVIIKIPFVPYIHPQFSETKNIVLTVRTDGIFKFL